MIEYKRVSYDREFGKAYVYGPWADIGVEDHGLPNIPTAVTLSGFLEQVGEFDWELAGIEPGKEHPVAEQCILPVYILKRKRLETK